MYIKAKLYFISHKNFMSLLNQNLNIIIPVFITYLQALNSYPYIYGKGEVYNTTFIATKQNTQGFVFTFTFKKRFQAVLYLPL